MTEVTFSCGDESSFVVNTLITKLCAPVAQKDLLSSPRNRSYEL
jgi:hypothetical protein